ncbi:substrate-binding periplasmic protein [Magnetovibrio blakemorei]|uniref:Amino acid ABC transporter n=1 Tax=Magnetovibrio blakemorei TaxID=28181 RepID=A0A1E5Q4M6_9PROT|nr:transporter substrate-binding domain-containing protein [Magnetovibrio blakemorei]OEJ64399.1 amino acid ABC transporter [Magnetovibrio blakemorei]
MKTMTLFLMLLAAMILPKSVSAETLKVCLDPWPPMTIFTTETQNRRGVVIDMMSDIYEKAGYTLEIFQVPYARGLQMVADGICDMLPEKEFSPLVDEDYVYADQATFAYPTAFIIRRDDTWRYTGIESVYGRRIATGEGWDYSSMSKAYQNHLDAPANKDFVEMIAGDANVIERILAMIAAGRVDMYADNVLVLNYVLNKTDLHESLQIVYPGLEKNLVEKPIFSLKLPEEKRRTLISIWDKGRRSLNDEDIRRYLQRYNLTVDLGS